MKKILALVLALVMTMSLATISSGAAFSDADSVQYTEAVNALTAYGVLGGYADGTIRPQADVTRGAAAKMVAMVATASNTTTIGYYKGTSSFADVPATHTFADAVAFCVARGIVAGYGDGNYGVADNVKGWAIAKMALVAMGYDAAAFGMEGAGSALNTITLASQNHLFDGMAADFNANEAASREECAQIVYNAMKQTTITKGTMNSDGSYTYVGSTAKLVDAYSALVEGVVMSNTATGAAATVVKTATGEVSLTNETGLDMIGHKVQFVDTKAAKVNGADTAFAVVDLSKVVEVPYGYVASEAANKALFGYKAADLTGTAEEFKNYKEDAANVAFTLSDATVTAGTYVLCDKEVVSYLTSDFAVGYIANYVEGTAAKNGSVSLAGDAAENWTLYTKTGETNYTMVNFYEGLKKGDIVIKQQTGLLDTLTLAGTVSGKVTAVNNGTNKTITIGGVEYAQSTLFADTADGDLGLAAGSLFSWTGAMNEDVVAYVDAYGSVFAITAAAAEEAADAGLVYVVGKYTSTAASNAYGEDGATSYFVQAVDMNGAEVTYQVKKAYYTTLNVAATGLCKAAVLADKDADNYDMAATYAEFSKANDAYGAWKLDSGVIDATAIKVGSDYFASDVKTLYVSGSLSTLKVTVVDGAQSTTGAAEYYAVKNGSNYDVKYIVTTETAGTVVSSTDVVYAASAASTKSVSYTKANGTAGTAAVYNVYINGVLTEVMVDAATANVAPVAGFNSYSIDSATGMYDFDAYSTKVDDEAVVTNVYGNLVTVSGVAGLGADIDASSAKIVDVWYAAQTDKTGLTEITTVAELDNALVAVVWTETAGVKSFATIYVLEQGHADGLYVGGLSKEYMNKVLGIDAALAAQYEAAGEDGVVLQFSLDTAATGASVYQVIEKDGSVYYTGSTITRDYEAGVAYFSMAQFDNTDTAGTYTIKHYVNGVVVASGTFVR